MGATPRQRRPPARGSSPAGRPALRRGRSLAGRRGRRGHSGPGALPARRHGGEPAAAELPGHEPRRGGLESAGCPLRDDRADLDGRAEAGGRAPGPERPGDGDPQRAHLPGMARGISPHGTARPLLELRGLHPHRRFDVQPARQVAEGVADAPLARADRLAQLPPDLPRLAPGPQRLLAPGPGIHRPRGQQEGRGGSVSISRRTRTRCSRSRATASGAATTST